jgi:hypothetical protein
METVAGVDEAGEAPQATEPAPEEAPPADTEQAPEKPGFGERGRMRRRARFLRKARELAYRDLGGLVFDLHRFGQRNDPLVLAKLAMLREIDKELRGLEQALHERRPVSVLREVGIAACPRCAAIHGSDDRFCPGCGLAFDANADRPISTAPMAPPSQAPAANTQPVTAGPAPATSRTVPAPTPMAAPAPASTPTGAPAPAPATAPAATPTAAPRAAAVPVKARDEDDEQTQILRPPVRDE